MATSGESWFDQHPETVNSVTGVSKRSASMPPHNDAPQQSKTIAAPKALPSPSPKSSGRRPLEAQTSARRDKSPRVELNPSKITYDTGDTGDSLVRALVQRNSALQGLCKGGRCAGGGNRSAIDVISRVVGLCWPHCFQRRRTTSRRNVGGSAT